VKGSLEVVRQLDKNLYPLGNYMAFGWEGIGEIGLASNVITNSQLDDYIYLSQIPLFDNQNTPCDE